MFQKKKPAASPTPAPTTPLPAAPVPALKRSFVSRETTVGMAVAGVFIAMVAAVIVTKTYFKSANSALAARNVVQAAPVEPEEPISKLPFANPRPTPPPAAAQPGVPEFQPVGAVAPPTFPPPPPDFSPPPVAEKKDAPPLIAFDPVPPTIPMRNEAPMIIVPSPEKKDVPPIIAFDPVPPAIPMRNDAPTIAAPPSEDPIAPMRKNDAPLIAAPPIDEPAPTRKNDAPLITLAPIDEPMAPVRPPAKDDFSSHGKKDPQADPPALPPISIDPIEPKIKNPVIIRTGGSDVKKDKPPAIDSPPPLDVPLLVEPKITEPAPKIELPAQPPAKSDLPPLTIDPPMVDVSRPADHLPPLTIDPPLDSPVKKEQPAKLEMSAQKPPPKKDNPPAVIDFGPVRKDGPPAFEIQPKTEVKKDGEYDEDLHSLKQNESFRAISKQYYNSEAYAIALQRYNGDHPGRADYVRVPPIWVLEKKYAGDISGSQARPVNFTQSPTADAAPRNDPVYTVGDNGEMLAEIARKRLGNEDAWKRIWDLNPQLNPAKTIPGGTRLRMPGQ